MTSYNFYQSNNHNPSAWSYALPELQQQHAWSPSLMQVYGEPLAINLTSSPTLNALLSNAQSSIAADSQEFVQFATLAGGGSDPLTGLERYTAPVAADQAQSTLPADPSGAVAPVIAGFYPPAGEDFTVVPGQGVVPVAGAVDRMQQHGGYPVFQSSTVIE